MDKNGRQIEVKQTLMTPSFVCQIRISESPPADTPSSPQGDISNDKTAQYGEYDITFLPTEKYVG